MPGEIRPAVHQERLSRLGDPPFDALPEGLQDTIKASEEMKARLRQAAAAPAPALEAVEIDILDLDEEYLVRVDVKLDIEALPLPMRPVAYIKGDWQIASEPWEWRLKP